MNGVAGHGVWAATRWNSDAFWLNRVLVRDGPAGVYPQNPGRFRRSPMVSVISFHAKTSAFIAEDAPLEESTADLLIEHGIRRAMNVILQGDGEPYGVLEVDSRSEGEFSANDITFLQGAANILGMAIHRQRMERNLTDALGRQQLMAKEVNHRI